MLTTNTVFQIFRHGVLSIFKILCRLYLLPTTCWILHWTDTESNSLTLNVYSLNPCTWEQCKSTPFHLNNNQMIYSMAKSKNNTIVICCICSFSLIFSHFLPFILTFTCNSIDIAHPWSQQLHTHLINELCFSELPFEGEIWWFQCDNMVSLFESVLFYRTVTFTFSPRLNRFL